MLPPSTLMRESLAHTHSPIHMHTCWCIHKFIPTLSSYMCMRSFYYIAYRYSLLFTFAASLHTQRPLSSVTCRQTEIAHFGQSIVSRFCMFPLFFSCTLCAFPLLYSLVYVCVCMRVCVIYMVKPACFRYDF